MAPARESSGMPPPPVHVVQTPVGAPQASDDDDWSSDDDAPSVLRPSATGSQGGAGGAPSVAMSPPTRPMVAVSGGGGGGGNDSSSSSDSDSDGGNAGRGPAPHKPPASAGAAGAADGAATSPRKGATGILDRVKRRMALLQDELKTCKQQLSTAEERRELDVSELNETVERLKGQVVKHKGEAKRAASVAAESKASPGPPAARAMPPPPCEARSTRAAASRGSRG